MDQSDYNPPRNWTPPALDPLVKNLALYGNYYCSLLDQLVGLPVVVLIPESSESKSLRSQYVASETPPHKQIQIFKNF